MSAPAPTLYCPVCEGRTDHPGLCATCAASEPLRRAFDEGQERLREAADAAARGPA